MSMQFISSFITILISLCFFLQNAGQPIYADAVDMNSGDLAMKIIACANVLYEPSNTQDITAFCPDGLRGICLFSVPQTFDVGTLGAYGCTDPKGIPVPTGYIAYYMDLRRISFESRAKIASTLLDLGPHGGRSYSLLAESARYVVTLPTKSLPLIDLALVDTLRERLRITPLASTKALKTSLLFPGQFRNPLVAEIVNSLSDDVFSNSLKALSGYSPIKLGSFDNREVILKSRNTFAPDNGYTAQFLMEKCTEFGYTFEKQSFFVGPTETVNIVCIIPGSIPASVESSNTIVIGAHYDTTSNDPKVNAPGAIDNGSGVSGLLTLLSAFQGRTFTSNIHAVFFSGSEQGLFGSQHYINMAVQQKYNVTAAFILDMISYSDSYFGLKTEGSRAPAIQSLMAYIEANVRIYAPELTTVSSVESSGSDHVSFQRAGIPAILLTQQDSPDYPHQRRTSDVFNYANIAQSMSILKVVAASVCQAAEILY